MSGTVIWITGLSGSGKTSLGLELCERLRSAEVSPIWLDGDYLRNIFQIENNLNVSYVRATRVKLAFRYSKLCQLLALQGFTVIIGTISMYKEIYTWNRSNLGNYFEVYLKVPMSELRKRDPKKIYKRFDDGLLENVSGLDLSVDFPLSPDLTLDFETHPNFWKTPSVLSKKVMQELTKKIKFDN